MTQKNEGMEEVVSKIRKLLALAHDSAKHSDESDTAMLMAQKLMAKNNIKMEDVNLDEPSNKNVIEGDGSEYTKLQWWMKDLARIIAQNFKCYNYIRVYGNKSKIVFLGLEEDVSICRMVYQFALTAIKYHADNYIKRRGVTGDRGITLGIKTDYITGYLQGLQAKFKEQVQSENLSLILVKDALVVQRYEGMKFTKGRGSSASGRGDSQARGQGFTDGKQFSHNKGMIQ
jgi:hypothetical protein